MLLAPLLICKNCGKPNDPDGNSNFRLISGTRNHDYNNRDQRCIYCSGELETISYTPTL